MESYLPVFFEAVWGNSIVPFGNEVTFYSMLSFGGFDMKLAAAIATLGAVVGLMFNWTVGRVMLKLVQRRPGAVNDQKYARVAQIFNKYLLFTLLLCWAPLCKFIPVFAGFLDTRFTTALALIAAGEAVHYALTVL